MAINKKDVCQSEAPEMDDLHAALSKAALMDIVIDLVRRNAGDETLDGVEAPRPRAQAVEAGPLQLVLRRRPQTRKGGPVTTRCTAYRRRGPTWTAACEPATTPFDLLADTIACRDPRREDAAFNHPVAGTCAAVAA